MSIDKLKTKFFTGAWLTDVKQYFSKINEIIDYLNGVGTSGNGSYKVYTALLTQDGTNAPIATIIQNTLGVTPIWSRTATGEYTLTASSIFTNNKTFVLLTPSHDFTQSGFNYKYTSSSTLQFMTFDAFGLVNSDDLLVKSSIEIRVYN